MSKSTIKDVARSAGVSETTVSLSFRENSRISEKTRKRVLAAAAKLNYIPNLAAKNLRSGTSNTIGFVVNDITNPFYGQMLRETEEVALRHGYNVIFADSNWLATKEKQLFEQMVQMRVSGMITCLSEKTRGGIGILDRFKVPYIAVDSCPDWYRGACVVNDFRMAGELAAKHLLEQGCQRPAYFTAGENMKKFSAFDKMQRFFGDFMNKNGVSFGDSNIITAGLRITAGHDGFEQAFQSGRRFDGIFCANDLCAIGVMEAAAAHGQTPGRDIAVIGIDDIAVSGTSRISLTSVRQPYRRIARLATRELIKSMASQTPPEIRIELPAELIVRSSSKILK